MTRRVALLLAIATAGLSACGFRPLYADGANGVAGAQLSMVAVGPIDDRSGWLLRNALIDRLGGDAMPDGARYRLDVEIDDDITRFGIRGDAAATRERRTLRARYQLVDMQTGETLLDSTAGSDAGIDITSSEYATVAAEETAAERLSKEVADDIVGRIGLYFNRSATQ